MAYALHWPTHGPGRIADQVGQRRYGGWRVSATGVYKILRRHRVRTRWERLARLEGEALVARGLLTERTARQLGKEGRHIEAERPGDLVCLDSFDLAKLKGGGRVWRPTACDAATS